MKIFIFVFLTIFLLSSCNQPNTTEIINKNGFELSETERADQKYLYVNSNEAGGGFYKNNNSIYYANVFDSRKLYRYDINADNSVLIADNIEKVLYIRMYDDIIYFTGMPDASVYGGDNRYSIFKISEDGSNLEMVIDYAMNSIIIDEYMYYLDRSQEYIYSICRYNLKNENNETLIDVEQQPYQINVVDNKIYYCTLGNTVVEYCIDTKETKNLAYEEYTLERLQYFDGALYYHSCFVTNKTNAKTLVKKIDLTTYEVETVFDFVEVYEHPKEYEIHGIKLFSLNVTENEIFFSGRLRMKGEQEDELGAFIYDRNTHKIQRIECVDTIDLMSMATYVTDDAIFYMKSVDIDNENKITVLDHYGNNISDHYHGLYVGIEE